MAHIAPIPREQLPQFEEMFKKMEAMVGFVPNSLKTMAHRPDIVHGYLALANAIMMNGTVPTRLKRMAALVSSSASGCVYCQAHMVIFGAVLDASPEDLADIWQFEFNNKFPPAEVAVLRLARDAGQVPNAVTKEHFDELRQHFSEPEIVELVGAIALFGYLNRWNDTMATDLEAEPLAMANKHLGPRGWTAGKHAGK
ncbi:MAG: carboxymuconolactone decarboxylase family protein [Gammaproteobacteria bacterium]|nr:carboxymuconolactone decarboxylase family protein [Gammaproteobacteria bacterium]